MSMNVSENNSGIKHENVFKACKDVVCFIGCKPGHSPPGGACCCSGGDVDIDLAASETAISSPHNWATWGLLLLWRGCCNPNSNSHQRDQQTQQPIADTNENNVVLKDWEGKKVEYTALSYSHPFNSMDCQNKLISSFYELCCSYSFQMISYVIF